MTPELSGEDRTLKHTALLRAQDRVNQTYEEHTEAINEVEELRRELGLGFYDKEQALSKLDPRYRLYKSL